MERSRAASSRTRARGTGIRPDSSARPVRRDAHTRVFDDGGELIHASRTGEVRAVRRRPGEPRLASECSRRGSGPATSRDRSRNGSFAACRSRSARNRSPVASARWMRSGPLLVMTRVLAHQRGRRRRPSLPRARAYAGIRFGAVEGDAPPDVLVRSRRPALSLSGGCVARRVAGPEEPARRSAEARVRGVTTGSAVYVAAQSGKVKPTRQPGLDLGPILAGGLGLGLELRLPFGPFQMGGERASAARDAGRSLEHQPGHEILRTQRRYATFGCAFARARIPPSAIAGCGTPPAPTPSADSPYNMPAEPARSCRPAVRNATVMCDTGKLPSEDSVACLVDACAAADDDESSERRERGVEPPPRTRRRGRPN